MRIASTGCRPPTNLSTEFYDHGGVLLLPLALRHAQRLQPALTGTDRTLQTAASGLATWAAWVANDAGRFDTAEQVGRLALALAERAADREAQAAAYSALSRISIGRCRPDHAVVYAKRGAALPGITEARRAWLHV